MNVLITKSGRVFKSYTSLYVPDPIFDFCFMSNSLNIIFNNKSHICVWRYK
jgi:hypothetical protein